MRYPGDKKGVFIHVGPYRSLTGANSDLWISCEPGTEALIALGLIREMVGHGQSMAYSEGFAEHLKEISEPYRRDTVIRISGISPEQYDALTNAVKQASAPLILGAGSGTMGAYSLQTDVAVNLLNVLIDPRLKLLDFNKRHRVEMAARRSDATQFFEAMNREPVDVLLIHRSNPAFYLSGEPAVNTGLRKEGMFKVCFSEVMNETAEYADLIFPAGHFLETWDEYAGVAGILSMVQPTMGSLYKAPGGGGCFFEGPTGRCRRQERHEDIPLQPFKRPAKGIRSGKMGGGDWPGRGLRCHRQ